MLVVCVHHQNIAVSETLCDWGETLCAACPNPSTVITAGTSTVVCVWDVTVSKDKLSHMKLRQVSLNVTAPWVYLNKHTLTYTYSTHFLTMLLLFSAAVVWPHGHSDVPGCVRGPQLYCEWLS